MFQPILKKSHLGVTVLELAWERRLYFCLSLRSAECAPWRFLSLENLIDFHFITENDPFAIAIYS